MVVGWVRTNLPKKEWTGWQKYVCLIIEHPRDTMMLCLLLINSYLLSSVPAGLMQEANDRKERRSKFSRRRMVINKSSLKLVNPIFSL